MGKDIKHTSSGTASGPNQQFKFAGSFDTGTWPTLLDAAEAKRVVKFIEDCVFRATYRIVTGNPTRNSFKATYKSGSVEYELELQTAVRHDTEPYLGGDLNLDQNNIVANGSGSVYKAYSSEGFTVASGAQGGVGQIKLNVANAGLSSGTGFGFKAPSSGAAEVIWELPDADGDDEQVMQTDGAGVLSWVDNAGGGGSMTSFDFSDPATNSFSVTNGNDVAFTSDDGSVTIDCSTADTIDLAAAGIPNIDGGTPDSVYVVNQNADGGDPSSTY